MGTQRTILPNEVEEGYGEATAQRTVDRKALVKSKALTKMIADLSYKDTYGYYGLRAEPTFDQLVKTFKKKRTVIPVKTGSINGMLFHRIAFLFWMLQKNIMT